MVNTPLPYDLVIGLGTSGMSMARYLHHLNRKVVATDMDGSKTAEAAALNALGIETQIGFHDPKTFNAATRLIPSPGIPPSSRLIQNALASGAQLTGELDIFFEHNTLPVIAITGTNGKTTTTTLTGAMLSACGMTPFVGGNIGTPLVECLINPQNTDVIVAEISSFQLDLASRFKPEVGVLLNISEDHLDRYNRYADYQQSKWSLFTRQHPDDHAVINSAVARFDARSKQLPAKILAFGPGTAEYCRDQNTTATIFTDHIDINLNHHHHRLETAALNQLCGTHNHENIAAAVLACLAIGADIQGITKGLHQFRNLPHRMEWVKTVNRVSFYNDSKATNTDAVIRALECFEHPVILILGGREKDTDFSLLIPAVQQKVRTIIAIGETQSKISRVFSKVCDVIEALDMKTAVRTGFDTAQKNESVLLSPACASFDMYQSYAHRGDDFKRHVNQIRES